MRSAVPIDNGARVVGVPDANRLTRPEALLIIHGKAAPDELVDAGRQLVRCG